MFGVAKHEGGPVPQPSVKQESLGTAGPDPGSKLASCYLFQSSVKEESPGMATSEADNACCYLLFEFPFPLSLASDLGLSVGSSLTDLQVVLFVCVAHKDKKNTKGRYKEQRE